MVMGNEETSVTIIPKGLHATEHQDGGIDEIAVTALSGLLADAQNPLAHEASHITGADLLDLNAQSFENLLRNGSFEVGDPPADWILAGAGATVSRSNAQANIGTYSALLTRIGADCRILQTIPSFARYRGRTVTFGAWVYATVADRARLRLETTASYFYSGYHSGGSTWEWLTISAEVEVGTVLLSAQCLVVTGNTSAYFDGAILVEGALCPSFMSKPASLFVHDVEVYNANAPVAWTDLDLSAEVGANPALVLVKIAGAAVDTHSIAFRRNGDTDEFYNAAAVHGVAAGNTPNAVHIVFLVLTDDDGIVEWICEAADAVVIDIMGVIK